MVSARGRLSGFRHAMSGGGGRAGGGGVDRTRSLQVPSGVERPDGAQPPRSSARVPRGPAIPPPPPPPPPPPQPPPGNPTWPPRPPPPLGPIPRPPGRKRTGTRPATQ